MKIIITAIIMVLVAFAKPAFPQREDTTRKQFVELSKTNEHHQLLAGLNGEWSFTGRHIMPDTTKRAFTFKGTITRRSIWEGRYFITETTGEKIKMPWAAGRLLEYRDMYVEGYDNVKKKFFILTINNESNPGVIMMEGSYDPETKTIAYEGESVSHFHPDMVAGTKVEFRVKVKIIDSDQFVYEQVEWVDGRKVVTTELRFTRVDKNSK
jgi:hypothetical protein